MDLTFREISTDSELRELALLAHRIWNDHYPPIIGQKQVDFMLERMYSIESLKDQIYNNNNIFICTFLRSEMVGFISYSKTNEDDYIIHKLYVNTKLHKRGIGRSLFTHVFGNMEFNTIRLTVNRQNYTAINFYFRIGFIIEKIIDIDIGEGFFMNDFVMLYINSVKK
jgi:ribosomal protein S18 acetylase RimI-like enzyme